MKMKKYLFVIAFIFSILFTNKVYASIGEVRYQVTDVIINEKTITFKGWAFIHQTNNYRNVKRLSKNGKTLIESDDIIDSNGGQKVKIYAYDDNEVIASEEYSGGSSNEINYNFTSNMFYEYKNDVNSYFVDDYNSGINGKMDCRERNCYYKDLYFEVTFDIKSNWYNKNIHFKISVTNNDFSNMCAKGKASNCDNGYTKRLDLFVLNDKYDGVSIKNNAPELIEIVSNSKSNKVKFLAETAVLYNSKWDRIVFSDPYGEIGSNFYVEKYEKESANNAKNIIINAIGTGKFFLYSSGTKDCTGNNAGKGRQCYFGSNSSTGKLVGAWSSWVVPTGETSFRIKANDNKLCPVTGLKTGDNILSCNNEQSMVSECEELTVKDDNGRKAIVRVKQSGTFANILSPTEKYNGGGIKFGLLYYNRVEFNFVSGDSNIDINTIMRDRIDNGNNISLSNVKIGNINVDNTIYKRCEQKISNNYVETVCLFHFTPQVVNSDGSISDVNNASYDNGINNKFYLPLAYNSVYRLSGSLINASILSKSKAINDTSGRSKVWFGDKWDKIDLSNSDSCDIYVYKLGPGAINNNVEDNVVNDNDNGNNSSSKIIYNFVYRPIDLNNPFPGNNRFVGLNWYNYDADRLRNAYSNLQYSVVLNNYSVGKIKSYNKENSYFDFDFERFINETGIKVGGNE